MKRIGLILISILLVITVSASCASKSGSPAKNIADYDYSSGEENYTSDSGAPAEKPSYQNETPRDDAADGVMPPTASAGTQDIFGGEMGAKIIKSGYLTIETLEFDEITSSITRKVQQEGGFISSSNIEGVSKSNSYNKRMRRAQFKIRIPSNRFEQFMTDIGELGNVTRNEKWGEDISGQYYDTEARVQSLTVREERILAIMQKAEELTDILELERELSRVRYEIESHTGTLKKWDSQVAYSSLDIDVYEVEEIKKEEVKPITVWEKITKGFSDSLKSVVKILEFMLVFFISAIPFLALFGIIALVAAFIIRWILGRKSKHIE